MIMRIKHGLEVQIDEEDYPLVCGFSWYKVTGRNYVVAPGPYVDGKQTKLYLHRFLLNVPKGMQVDHINGDGLDNRKCNLRLCTQSQNCMNRRHPNKFGYKGVGLVNHCKARFRAQIMVEGRPIRLGHFDSPEEAARAYDEAAKKYHGEFACLNFP